MAQPLLASRTKCCGLCANFLQAEEAARRAEQQAAEAARRQAEREERLRRAAEYQEPEWARQGGEAAEDEEVWSYIAVQSTWADRPALPGSCT